MAAAISANPGYIALTRDFKQIMEEHKLQESGLIKDEDRKKLGDALGASYILRVEVAMFDTRNVVLTASIIDLVTGSMVEADPVIAGIEKEEMKESCGELAGKWLAKGDV